MAKIRHRIFGACQNPRSHSQLYRCDSGALKWGIVICTTLVRIHGSTAMTLASTYMSLALQRLKCGCLQGEGPSPIPGKSTLWTDAGVDQNFQRDLGAIGPYELQVKSVWTNPLMPCFQGKYPEEEGRGTRSGCEASKGSKGISGL